MHERPITKYLPGLERLEEKQLLSASPSSTPLASHGALASQPADTPSALGAVGGIPKAGKQ